MSPKKAGENAHRFVPDLIAISIDERDADERRRGLERAAEVGRGRRAGPGDLRERFRRPEDVTLVDRVSRFVDFAVVDDPVQAARDAMAADERVTASPVHALGFHWHAPYSATTPEPVNEVEFPSLPAGARDKVIAVVDTGIAPSGDLPGWMSSSLIHGLEDVEPLHEGEVSHGTFVASLLRQIAPTHSVSMARTGEFGTDEEHDDDHPRPDPTTEFHVAGAIDRLIERHKGHCHVEALNLSVGGPAHEDMVMVTLQQAIGKWRDAFPTTPIFAAAGNTPHPQAIYPAAFRYVRGVAAADPEGRQIVWRHDNSTDDPPVRDWVDDVAPGADLIGLGGRAADDTIKWSGSSFSTAVAAASHVNGGPIEVVGGIAYWPDRAMRYGDVPGLRFE